jgi:hypothetical protein
MSVQHANIGVVKKDLQLYYNREFIKSFRGEATTNLLPRTTTFDPILWTGYCGSATNVTYNTTDIVDAFGGYNAIKVIRNGNNACGGAGTVAMGLFYNGPAILVSGQTYTISFYARSAVAGTLLRGGLNDGHTFGYVTLTTSWARYSFTFTNISNTSRGFQFVSDQSVAGETYYLCYPQLENRSYATPYSDIAQSINVRAATATNLLTSTYSSLPTNWSVDGSGQGTIGSYSYIENNSAIRVADINSNTRFYVSFLTGFSAFTFYTFSVKYRKVSGTPTLRFQIQYYSSLDFFQGFNFPTTSEINIYDVDGWQLAYFTVITPANTAKITWFIQDGDDFTTYNHTYDLKEPQIQTGSIATAWTSNTATANTLTSGGGLLDISGNNVNADLTNVGFGSSGFTFNGSTQFINLGTSKTSLNISADLTVEAMIKLTSSFTYNPTIVGNGYWQEVYPYKLQFEYNSNNGNLGLFRYDGTNYRYALWNFGSQSTYFLNKYAHVVATYNSLTNTFAIYYNGDSQTVTQGNPGTIGINNTTNFVIGAQVKTDGVVADPFPGEINFVRVYNRGLTAAEVLQNFNATRKTYGI